jgi:hypothetical protein
LLLDSTRPDSGRFRLLAHQHHGIGVFARGIVEPALAQPDILRDEIAIDRVIIGVGLGPFSAVTISVSPVERSTRMT